MSLKRNEVMNFIKQCISREKGIPLSEIQESDTFFSLGLDSISSIFLMEKLERFLKHELNPIHFWDYPSLGEYVDFLVREITTDE
jgi:acyl carrier protein